MGDPEPAASTFLTLCFPLSLRPLFLPLLSFPFTPAVPLAAALALVPIIWTPSAPPADCPPAPLAPLRPLALRGWS